MSDKTKDKAVCNTQGLSLSFGWYYFYYYDRI